MGLEPRRATLIGTYATRSLGEIIATALEVEGIPTEIVASGDEGEFPALGLVAGDVGVFVPTPSAQRARAICAAIEETD